MLTQVAEWVAPAATMIAAMLTAANLGSRVTGWGFAIFSVGALAWVIVGMASGQHNLLLSNAFLGVVDLIGVWRWLGLRARYDKGAEAAEAASGARTPQLLQLTKLAGLPVKTRDGADVGRLVDAMLDGREGQVAYLVVALGGIAGAGETLHALGWPDVQIGDEALVSAVDAESLSARAALDPERWPASAKAAGAA